MTPLDVMWVGLGGGLGSLLPGTTACPSIASLPVECRLRKEWARFGLMRRSTDVRHEASTMNPRRHSPTNIEGRLIAPVS